ncbi:DUF4065 domain-containing protein [Agrobacterium rhizogenes]|nr:DUF4065 domain-containing protein [Rhizobium rhizogenes]NTH38147.1 DUF4065 domain-containing protein [Rhizobium rhizogenes]NTJ00577.1 DUF4065 domain-containing protein [Rhizobium rhizogenes]
MNTALDVANWFVGSIDRNAGDSITHLKVQKLVFYAQVWSLALYDEPIFGEDFKAWAHGPVVESVYQQFSGSGWDALPPPKEVPRFDERAEELLGDILASYGGLSAKQLEYLTHSEEPWIKARGNLAPEARSNVTISKESIIAYYKKLNEDVEAGVER